MRSPGAAAMIAMLTMQHTMYDPGPRLRAPLTQPPKRKCLRQGCTNMEVRNGFCCAACYKQYQSDRRGTT